VTHRFIADFLYDLPALSGSNSAVRHVIGGWQASGIFSASRGEPLRISWASSISASRPDNIGGDTFTSDRGEETLQYLNKAAFARVRVGSASGATLRPGNLGNGAVRLPGAWNLDFLLGKNFSLTGRFRMQIRADMFNAFSHPNFSSVSTNLTSGSFGRFTNTQGARIVQLNARLSF
jgi:hypothetical protein